MYVTIFRQPIDYLPPEKHTTLISNCIY